VTVHAYEQPATGLNQYQNPETAGDEFSAADVELCATGGQALSANPFNFELQMPYNARRQPSFGKEPGLNATNLTAGDCVRGWVTFEVPAGVRPSYLVYNVPGLPSSGAQPLKWAVG
jgi:hypothetical protein